MKIPELSIIMPVYNVEYFVASAIQSVLEQTYQDFELIIINDGSTDGSKTVINSFTDKRISYFENEINSGIVYSRNKGLKMAKGKFVGMFDADDIAHREKFEKQIAFLEKNPEFGMVGSWAKFIDAEGKHIPSGWKLKAKPEAIPAIMLFKNYFVQSAVLYRRECISNYKFQDGFDILEDYLMWYEILKKYKVWNLQEYLIKYRIHEGGVTKKYQLEKEEKEREVFRIQIQGIGIEPTEDELKIHQLIRNDLPVSNLQTLKSIEQWLLKIITANNISKIYNQKILKKVVRNRWIKSCYKTKDIFVLYKLVKSSLFLYQ